MNEMTTIKEKELLQKWLSNIQTRIMVINSETEILIQGIQLIQKFIKGEQND